VWPENDFNGQYVMANRYTAGSGWGTATMISANVDTTRASQIAIDANGNGVAVWEQYNGTPTSVLDIMANRFVAGTGWRTARSITTDKTHDAKAPQVAFDSKGNALAVWAGTTLGSTIWSSRFAANATDWDTAAPIFPVNKFATLDAPQLAFDAKDNAYAVWTQFVSGQSLANDIAASRLAAGGTWTDPELIESDTGAASVPQIAVDANGNATAIWQQSDGTRNNVVANRFE
jgi:hypothetical protein